MRLSKKSSNTNAKVWMSLCLSVFGWQFFFFLFGFYRVSVLKPLIDQNWFSLFDWVRHGKNWMSLIQIQQVFHLSFFGCEFQWSVEREIAFDFLVFSWIAHTKHFIGFVDTHTYTWSVYTLRQSLIIQFMKLVINVYVSVDRWSLIVQLNCFTKIKNHIKS